MEKLEPVKDRLEMFQSNIFNKDKLTQAIVDLKLRVKDYWSNINELDDPVADRWRASDLVNHLDLINLVWLCCKTGDVPGLNNVLSMARRSKNDLSKILEELMRVRE